VIVKLPDGNGVELSQKIKQLYPNLEIILLTAYRNIPDGVQAMKNGAFDYIVKGSDNHKIVPLVHRAIEKIEANKVVVEKTAIAQTDVRVVMNSGTDSQRSWKYGGFGQ
jgi:DNA-binding NtrC family response regulator